MKRFALSPWSWKGSPSTEGPRLFKLMWKRTACSSIEIRPWDGQSQRLGTRVHHRHKESSSKRLSRVIGWEFVTTKFPALDDDGTSLHSNLFQCCSQQTKCFVLEFSCCKPNFARLCSWVDDELASVAVDCDVTKKMTIEEAPELASRYFRNPIASMLSMSTGVHSFGSISLQIDTNTLRRHAWAFLKLASFCDLEPDKTFLICAAVVFSPSN